MHHKPKPHRHKKNEHTNRTLCSLHFFFIYKSKRFVQIVHFSYTDQTSYIQKYWTRPFEIPKKHEFKTPVKGKRRSTRIELNKVGKKSGKTHEFSSSFDRNPIFHEGIGFRLLFALISHMKESGTCRMSVDNIMDRFVERVHRNWSLIILCINKFVCEMLWHLTKIWIWEFVVDLDLIGMDKVFWITYVGERVIMEV